MNTSFFNQKNFVVFILFLTLAEPSLCQSVHEILQQFRLPGGLLPDAIKNYTFSHEDGSFTVELVKQHCEVKLDDYVISYDQHISGTLKFGFIKDLKGIQMKRYYLFRFDVGVVKVDLPPSDWIYFQVGLFNKKLELDQFRTLHSCLESKKPAVDLPYSAFSTF